MSALKETVFVGRNNVLRLTLSEDATPFATAYPSTTPTRWVFTINTTPPVIIDSSTTPSAFDWDAVNSILEIRPGSLVSAAVDYTLATLVIYAAEWPEGLVWVSPTCTPDKILVRVCDNS